MYIAGHDRIVDLIVKDISNHLPPLVRIYKHSCVNSSLFQYLNINSEIVSHMSADTPDVAVINEECRKFVLEVACTFDSSMEEAFMTKVIKYQSLLNTISEVGYRGRLFVFIFGSLGHTHRLVVRAVSCKLLVVTTSDAQKEG